MLRWQRIKTPYYDRGGHQIYLASCLDVLPELEPVDCVITDPPYARDVYARLRGPNTHAGSGTPKRLGNESSGSLRRERSGQSRERFGDKPWTPTTAPAIAKLAAGFIGDVDDLIAPVSLELARLCRRWSVVFSDAESIHLWREALVVAGMRYVRTGCWAKPDPMPQFSGDRPSVGFEPCTITHAQGPMRWNGGGHSALWTHNTVKGNAKARSGHPCPKPLGLMRELVSLFSDPGDLILDPFAGSGTTARACKDLGRRSISIEINEQWAEAAARRLEQEVFDFEPSPCVVEAL